MDKTQKKLKEETEKWLKKLEDKLEKKNKSIDQMENVVAYRHDTEYFLQQSKYIKSFESVIYAWAILETLERLNKFDKSE